MFTKALKIFSLLFTGFVGGTLSPWVMGWVKENSTPGPSDAVAIANTYIVFTTIIFVGVTVILAVTGYVFTQQFSASKHAQEKQILDELREKIREDEKVGIALADAILENSDVKRHLQGLIGAKMNEIVSSRLEESVAIADDLQASADLAKEETKALQSLGAQLNGNGKGGTS